MIGFRNPSDYDARLFESTCDSRARNVKDIGEFIDAFPGIVEFDDLINVERDSFFGHVYDASSLSTLYIANGIITSNCRCTFTIEVDDWDKWMDDYEKRHGNGQAGKVANRIDSDIISSSSTKEDIQVHSVGKINRDIYKCITEDIVTDEVIITENQIQHILDRHPDAYKEVINYLSDIIRNPDFIIEDKHDSTGLVIKKVRMEKEYAQMVLRICTSDDNPNYKNSVISCWEISEKRLQNYLRNKRILYKKE